MNLFKHTRGQDYCQTTPSSPSANQSYPVERTETGRPEVDQPGFFSNEAELSDPVNWIPGFITSIEGNRFRMRDMKKIENKFKFFIPAKLFDPESNYALAKENVYQVIFGKQVTKRQQVTTSDLSDDNIPESFKKWAQLKNSNISAPAPAAAPKPGIQASTGNPTRIQISPTESLTVGQEVYGAVNPDGVWAYGTIAGFTPDAVLIRNERGVAPFPFVIASNKKNRSDWKKYVICAKRDGAPASACHAPTPSCDSKPETTEQKKEGKAGLDRALMDGDVIIASDNIDFAMSREVIFSETNDNSFVTSAGTEYRYAIPVDIYDHVGRDMTHAKKFILKVVDGEIKAVHC